MSHSAVTFLRILCLIMSNFLDAWQKWVSSVSLKLKCSKAAFFGAVFASKGHPFKNIFDFTTAGDWDCVAAVERLPAIHYSVDFIFLSFGIMGFIVEL